MKEINFEKEVGFIWDIDGVVADSPHEEAWRVTVQKKEWGVTDFSSEFYFKHVASRPRYEGGNNILEKKGVYESSGAKTGEEKNKLLEKFCSQKNMLIRKLIKERNFGIFDSSVALILEAKKCGVKQAAASASKNARDMLTKIDYNWIIKSTKEVKYDFLKKVDNLYTLFDVQACGLDLKGKPNILRFAAEELRKKSNYEIKEFVVFEDAPTGLKPAKEMGMFAVGTLRIGRKEDLLNTGADLVVEDLSEISYQKLKEEFMRSQ